MEQYISKSVLVAEIKRLAKVGHNNASAFDESRNERTIWLQQADVCNRILSFVDTLEVKEWEDSTIADMAEEIIINIKRVENDYHIDLTKQMEWLRNIVKKGKRNDTFCRL